MTIDLSSMSTTVLRRAVEIKETIETLTHELASLVKGSGTVQPATKIGGRRKMSAAARAKIGAATKARWARQNKATGSSKSPSAAKATSPANKKRSMSPAAKAKLSAITKARWAKIKAAGKTSM